MSATRHPKTTKLPAAGQIWEWTFRNNTTAETVVMLLELHDASMQSRDMKKWRSIVLDSNCYGLSTGQEVTSAFVIVTVDNPDGTKERTVLNKNDAGTWMKIT